MFPSSKSDTIQDVEMFILNVQASIKPYVFQLRLQIKMYIFLKDFLILIA